MNAATDYLISYDIHEKMLIGILTSAYVIIGWLLVSGRIG